MQTNKEGLTEVEWYHAANYFRQAISSGKARQAWERGEDPTEYAAAACRRDVKRLRVDRARGLPL